MWVKLTFYGAAKAVTGSCHCLECGGKRILVDCGLQQGKDEWNNGELEFQAGSIDCVIVTHAHIDHTGRLPLLVKQGFRGSIVCTRLTAQLMSIMLRDSAHIQESDAKWKNQKGRRAGRPVVEPLYTLADAEATMELVRGYEYGQDIQLTEGVRVRFTDAGHLLGSACAEVWLTEGNETRKVVFTGDLGNVNQPIIRDPQPLYETDYLVTESTYGDRLHEGTGEYAQELARVIDATLARGGNVIIPSFAVGRTQELLYFMREMKEKGLVKSDPDFTVCVDSPLANEATRIFSGDLRGYLDEEAIERIKGGTLFLFQGLELIESSEESRALNEDPKPKVIISASGMCDAGRIRHHLKHNLWRKECAVVFVGYQAEGTLGRLLLDGAASVRMFGEEIAVRARIINFKGLSSHADRNHLLSWAKNFAPAPRHTFVVHGEARVAETYAQTLRENRLDAHAPDPGEIYDLLADRMVKAGEPRPEKSAREMELYASPAFRRLEDVAQKLLETVQHNRGGTNKDLTKFADQLAALIEKWDR